MILEITQMWKTHRCVTGGILKKTCPGVTKSFRDAGGVKGYGRFILQWVYSHEREHRSLDSDKFRSPKSRYLDFHGRLP